MILTLRRLLLAAGLLLSFAPADAQPRRVDLLIVGGGASATTAAIQAARMGTNVLVVNPEPWLGGMLTSAGVSAIDGNHRLPSGLWGEFRRGLYDHYGGPEAVFTGWVSNTQFEPSVGAALWRRLADDARVPVWYQATWTDVRRDGDGWRVSVQHGGRKRVVRARLLLDATELGDVLAAVGAGFDVGMDSRHVTGEAIAPETANNIVQDLTYVAVLKDYGPGADRTLPRPPGYDPAAFSCACNPADSTSCRQMLDYGRLPNDKYMINWPRCGNDYYVNLIPLTPPQRDSALAAARLETLRFVYYLQTELGFRHLGLAEGEFPTADHLPMMAYHREARRLHGRVRLTLNHLAAPFSQPDPLYRTGVAVGDYPIDHHHDKNAAAPDIDFLAARVPAYNVPLGALIPRETPGLIVAEKSISVTNIVNGATRLQPVVMELGQAAGALAALALRAGVDPSEVPVRAVQQVLLDAGGYLMPYLDVPPDDPHFAAVQRVGATGILRGTGVPYQWANQTWFYPSHPVSAHTLAEGLRSFYPDLTLPPASGADLTLPELTRLLGGVDPAVDAEQTRRAWQQLAAGPPADDATPLTRRQVAVLVDALLHPFAVPVDLQGHRSDRPVTGADHPAQR